MKMIRVSDETLTQESTSDSSDALIAVTVSKQHLG